MSVDAMSTDQAAIRSALASTPRPPRISATSAALASAGVPLAGFTLGQPSLDEVFLALTGRPAEEQETEEATA